MITLKANICTPYWAHQTQQFIFLYRFKGSKIIGMPHDEIKGTTQIRQLFVFVHKCVCVYQCELRLGCTSLVLYLEIYPTLYELHLNRFNQSNQYFFSPEPPTLWAAATVYFTARSIFLNVVLGSREVFSDRHFPSFRVLIRSYKLNTKKNGM